MQYTSVPTKVTVQWGASAGGSYIRVVPVTSADPNAATFTNGFPPPTFAAIGAGGVPPDGRDFNGAFNIISKWIQWGNAGAPVFYDSAFSTAVGGYPKWAMLSNATTPGQFWISTVDDNTSNPDASGANWLTFPPAAAVSVTSFNTRTGAVTLTSTDVTDALAANALANAKLAQMANNTVKGNVSGGTATPADVTLTALIAALGVTLSLGTTGYAKLFGFTIQWTTTTAISENTGIFTVTWPTAFTTACVGFICQVINSTGNPSADWQTYGQVVDFSTSQGRLRANATDDPTKSFPFFVIAFGY